MKLTRNKILIYILIPFAFSSCFFSQGEKQESKGTLYRWGALLSAPRFYRSDMEFKVWCGKDSIMATGMLSSGWGEVGPGFIVDDDMRPLPTKASVTWHSYAEGVDYKADFNLDTIKIKALFNKRTENERTDLCCAVAPGGVAVVWVINFQEYSSPKYTAKGDDRIYTEVARSKGVATSSKNPNYKKELLPSELYWINKHGLCLGNWDAWPKKYPWKPVVLAPEKGYVESFRFQIYTSGGNLEQIDNWFGDKPDDADSATYCKHPTNLWNEIELDTSGIKARGIPCFIELGLGNKPEKKGIEAYLTFSREKIITAFESGKYNLLVFEVHKDRSLSYWLYGKGRERLKIGDAEILDEEWEETINKKTAKSSI